MNKFHMTAMSKTPGIQTMIAATARTHAEPSEDESENTAPPNAKPPIGGETNV